MRGDFKQISWSFLAASFVLLGTSPAWSDIYELSSFTFSSGGGASSGGAYAEAGSLGLPAPEQASGGAYDVDLGPPPSLLPPAQNTQPPLLIVRRQGESVVVSWPANAAGFVLQQSTGFDPFVWSDVPNPPVDSGGLRNVRMPLSVQMIFVRLKQ